MQNQQKLKTITIYLKKRKYNVELDKILYILSRFENKNIKFKSQAETIEYLKKFKLLDKYFLQKVNEIKLSY